MNEEPIDSLGKERDGDVLESESTGDRMTGVRDQMRSILCNVCEAKGILDEFDDEEVIACPSCENILYRSVRDSMVTS